MGNKTINRHFGSFNIAGFTYWEGCMALRRLHIGTQLRLVREADNKFDPYAVAIYYKEYKLGFIPQGKNQPVSQLLDLGYNDIFDLRVQQLLIDAHPEKQVSVVLFIKQRSEINH